MDLTGEPAASRRRSASPSPTSSPASTASSPSRPRCASATDRARAATSTWRCSTPRSRARQPGDELLRRRQGADAHRQRPSQHRALPGVSRSPTATSSSPPAMTASSASSATCSACRRSPTTRLRHQAARVANRDALCGAASPTARADWHARRPARRARKRPASRPARSTPSPTSSPIRRSRGAGCGSTSTAPHVAGRHDPHGALAAHARRRGAGVPPAAAAAGRAYGRGAGRPRLGRLRPLDRHRGRQRLEDSCRPPPNGSHSSGLRCTELQDDPHDGPATRTGGQLIVDCLAAQGVEHVFCVPGESYLAVLDALHDAAIDVTVCRQEGGAAMMADATARLTGRPGIAMVTRGPGATNASHGVHIAEQDFDADDPVRRPDRARHARPRGLPGDRLPRRLRLAWRSGRSRSTTPPASPRSSRAPSTSPCRAGRGPVVIALPEDMLLDSGRGRRRAARRAGRDLARPHPDGRPAEAALGGAAPRHDAGRQRLDGDGLRRACARFAERFDLPVADLVPPRRCCSRPTIRTMPAISASAPTRSCKARIEDADLVIARRRPHGGGAVAGLHAVRHPRAAPDARARPRRRRGARPRLPARARHQRDARPPSPPRWRRCSRRTTIAWARRRGRRARTTSPGPSSRRVDPRRVPVWRGHGLAAQPPAGRRHRHQRRRQLRDLGRTASCASAASARSSRRPRARWATACRPRSAPSGSIPDRMVVCFAGDGCFLMNGQEFATAVQYDLPIVVVVVDNGMYGTIRMHQEREYPGRVSATRAEEPRFRRLRPRLRRPWRAGGDDRRSSRRPSSAPWPRASPPSCTVLIDPEAITPAHDADARCARRRWREEPDRKARGQRCGRGRG